MKIRHGLIVAAALSMAAGCASVETTTQTSMLRGPTPSSGMSIPQLLVIPTPSASDLPVDPGASAAGATAETPLPPTDAPVSEDPPVTDQFSAPQPEDQVVPTAAGTAPAGTAPAAGPDLSALAAAFSCLDYTEQEDPEPLVASWGTCVLDDQQILLYGFADDQSAADYRASLDSSGVTAEELVPGPGYLIWADPASAPTIKATLGLG